MNQIFHLNNEHPPKILQNKYVPTYLFQNIASVSTVSIPSVHIVSVCVACLGNSMVCKPKSTLLQAVRQPSPVSYTPASWLVPVF